MNKTILLGAMACCLALASCKDEPENGSMNYSCGTYNLITEEGVDEPTVSSCTYNFLFSFGNTKLAAITGKSLELPGGEKVDVSMTDIPYSSVAGQFDSSTQVSFLLKSPSGKTVGTLGDYPITGLQAELSSAVYYPTEDIAGYPVLMPTYKYTVMSYRAGDKYRVRTFWPDVTFKGVTGTSYKDAEGVPQAYTTEDILYRIVMDIEKKTATVLMYNAKFAEGNMPKLNIILKDLPLTFTNSGYTISAQNVIPYYVEGGVLTEQKRFPFDSFELSAGGDMTVMRCVFKVAGAYNGSFQGTYLVSAAS